MKLSKIKKLIDEIVELNDCVELDIVKIKNNFLPKLKEFPSVKKCLTVAQTEKDIRFLCRYNLFFLISCIFNRNHLLTQWTLNRCIECQKNPNGFIQLWAREHHKSSIWTIGKTIQDILQSHGKEETLDDVSENIIESIYSYLKYDETEDDTTLLEKFKKIKKYDFTEEVTVGILSVTKTLSEAFLSEIKTEFEKNELLISLFPDVLYKNPFKFSEKWSIKNGIIVKRKSVRKEATIEAWGLVVGQPTSKHFTICMFDDVFTHDYVKTLYMNQVVITSWENAFSLGSNTGVYRAVGTRKHYSDPYSNMIERKAFTPVIYTPYDKNNQPVLMKKEELEKRRINSGEATFSAEYLQEPLKDSALGLKVNNLMQHEIENTNDLCLYMICDPAKAQKKHSDYSVFLIFGIDPDKNILLIDGIRDRLKLSEKWKELYSLYKKYPNIKQIYYEEVGNISDTQYFEIKMNECAHFFSNKLNNIPGKILKESKKNRILKIEPYLDQKKIYFPESLKKQTKDFRVYDLIKEFKKEIEQYPDPEHDDLLDCLAYCIIFLQKGMLLSFQEESEDDEFINQLKFDASQQENFLLNM
jgi:phage terminase large subunit-like protein